MAKKKTQLFSVQKNTCCLSMLKGICSCFFVNLQLGNSGLSFMALASADYVITRQRKSALEMVFSPLGVRWPSNSCGTLTTTFSVILTFKTCCCGGYTANFLIFLTIKC